MARLTFGGCRPKPGQPCPLCGKPVTQMRGRSLLTAYRLADWIVCSGAPRCGYVRRAQKNKAGCKRQSSNPAPLAGSEGGARNPARPEQEEKSLG
jgi:ssDNA-binding Zn-finger/Zn-ribbon topoisomerase 1